MTALTRPVFPAPQLRARMSEAEFQLWVTDLAGLHGWSWHHEQDSRKSKSGFPDLFMWHPGRGLLIVAELKREKDFRVSPAQRETLQELTDVADAIARDAGYPLPKRVHVALWRPSHMEAIEEMLR